MLPWDARGCQVGGMVGWDGGGVGGGWWEGKMFWNDENSRDLPSGKGGGDEDKLDLVWFSIQASNFWNVGAGGWEGANFILTKF